MTLKIKSLSKLYEDMIKKMEAKIFVVNKISMGCPLGVKENKLTLSDCKNKCQLDSLC